MAESARYLLFDDRRIYAAVFLCPQKPLFVNLPIFHTETVGFLCNYMNM